MRNMICAILTLLFAIATLVGIGLMGVNVIMCLFEKGGNYVQAIAGFALTFGCSLLTSICAKGVKD